MVVFLVPLNISHDQFHKISSVHSDKKLELWLPPVTKFRNN